MNCSAFKQAAYLGMVKKVSRFDAPALQVIQMQHAGSKWLTIPELRE
jgi:hypothetical protein